MKKKQQRVQQTKQHLNVDFTHTIFTDEASFQLFRNSIRHWSKHPNAEFKRKLKKRQSVRVWGSISFKGMLTFHTFRCNLNSQYYIDILKNHLLSAAKQQFRKNWRLQQDNDPKHRSNIIK